MVNKKPMDIMQLYWLVEPNETAIQHRKCQRQYRNQENPVGLQIGERIYDARLQHGGGFTYWLSIYP